MQSYKIIDEPCPGFLSRFVVDPLWPLFSFMLGGSVFSWLWSGFNSLALGGPNLKKELATIVMAFVGLFSIYFLAHSLYSRGFFEDFNKQYLFLLITSVEISFCYLLFSMQKEGVEIHEYFNGKLASAVPGLLLALLFGKNIRLFVLSVVIGSF